MITLEELLDDDRAKALTPELREELIKRYRSDNGDEFAGLFAKAYLANESVLDYSGTKREKAKADRDIYYQAYEELQSLDKGVSLNDGLETGPLQFENHPDRVYANEKQSIANKIQSSLFDSYKFFKDREEKALKEERLVAELDNLNVNPFKAFVSEEEKEEIKKREEELMKISGLRYPQRRVNKEEARQLQEEEGFGGSLRRFIGGDGTDTYVTSKDVDKVRERIKMKSQFNGDLFSQDSNGDYLITGRKQIIADPENAIEEVKSSGLPKGDIDDLVSQIKDFQDGDIQPMAEAMGYIRGLGAVDPRIKKGSDRAEGFIKGEGFDPYDDIGKETDKLEGLNAETTFLGLSVDIKKIEKEVAKELGFSNSELLEGKDNDKYDKFFKANQVGIESKRLSEDDFYDEVEKRALREAVNSKDFNDSTFEYVVGGFSEGMINTARLGVSALAMAGDPNAIKDIELKSQESERQGKVSKLGEIRSDFAVVSRMIVGEVPNLLATGGIGKGAQSLASVITSAKVAGKVGTSARVAFEASRIGSSTFEELLPKIGREEAIKASWINASVGALITSGLNKVGLDSIEKVSSAQRQYTKSLILNNLKSRAKRVGLFKGMTGEAIQEELQTRAELITNNLFLNPKDRVSWEDINEQARLARIVGFAMGGIAKIPDVARNIGRSSQELVDLNFAKFLEDNKEIDGVDAFTQKEVDFLYKNVTTNE